jgi:polyisoprenoid-binding protein YceI
MSSFKTRSIGKSLLFPLALGLTTAMAFASETAPSWMVNTAASTLTFNTTKAGTAGVGGITEIMRFTRYEGGVDAKGRISFKIDLTSIDSGIAIRDERLQTMFWNVGTQPSVTFSAQLSPETLQKLSKEAMVLDVDGQLTMAGQTKPAKTQLQVTPVNGKVLVSTRRPILVKADDFGLTPGVEALRAIMGLNFLSSSVPVNFSLEMTQKVAEKAASTSTY